VSESRIERLEAENDTLRERVRQLHGLLTSSDIDLPREWRLTAQEAKLFGVLLARKLATREAIMAGVYGDRLDDEPSIAMVQVLACKLRRKLQPFGIEIATVWGVGYQLQAEQRDHWRGRRNGGADPSARAIAREPAWAGG
jgi:two-component system cell cycle response regulator CtrA